MRLRCAKYKCKGVIVVHSTPLHSEFQTEADMILWSNYGVCPCCGSTIRYKSEGQVLYTPDNWIPLEKYMPKPDESEEQLEMALG